VASEHKAAGEPCTVYWRYHKYTNSNKSLGLRLDQLLWPRITKPHVGRLSLMDMQHRWKAAATSELCQST